MENRFYVLWRTSNEKTDNMPFVAYVQNKVIAEYIDNKRTEKLSNVIDRNQKKIREEIGYIEDLVCFLGQKKLTEIDDVTVQTYASLKKELKELSYLEYDLHNLVYGGIHNV